MQSSNPASPETRPSKTQSAAVDGFRDLVFEALERWDDPVWLGGNSVLAQPYVLGERQARSPEGQSAGGRGRLLQLMLLEAALDLAEPPEDQRAAVERLRAQLERGSQQHRALYGSRLKELLRAGSRAQQLLYWSFFHEPRFAKLEPLLDSEHLNMPRATFYRLRPQAVEQLCAALIRRIRPALRQETPQPATLVGRAALAETAQTALGRGELLGLTGPGGVGKTALGVAVAKAFAPERSFWYTIRPGLNDQLTSLLFALGAFLHSHGSSSLWLQLSSTRGALAPLPALNLLRFDLDQIGAAGALLCFDELDLLRPAEVEAHAQIVTLIEGLRGVAPMVLIGQRLPCVPDRQLALEGLPPADLARLAARDGLALDPAAAAALHQATGGNPRLAELFGSLHQPGDPVEATLRSLGASAALDVLLRRVVQRLDLPEREVLLELAVFPQPAPADSWPAEALDGLAARHLVQLDAAGGAELLPAFRGVLEQQIAPEEREGLHLRAAAVRLRHGEHTAAVYHLAQAGQPAEAVWLWHMHRAQEIDQGQARTALAILGSLPPGRLDSEGRRVLALARSELHLLLGDTAAAEQDLQGASWLQGDTLTGMAQRVAGGIADLQSAFGKATSAYRAGLETMEHVTAQIAHLHKHLGWMAQREKDLDLAWREACLARYEAANLQGYVQEEQGNYARAEALYHEALALAQELGHTQGEAKTRNNLGSLLSRQDRFTDALDHFERAGQLFTRIGNRSMCASVRVNQALACNLSGDPAAALAHAGAALVLFDQLGQPYGRAVAAQNQAEAHLALGQLDAAEQAARMVLGEEEPSTMPDGLRVLGEVALARGQLSAAEELVDQSRRLAEQNQDPYLAAYAWRALGQVRRSQRRPDAAGEAFAAAITLFGELGLENEIAKTRGVEEG
ncbi:MAG TPA: tetratricopeptide repeat protein [Roseiflexaceae bacterium]|nr:tetratricopeptide repeat protein [Roseiflexaceae bacterium]